MVPQIDLASPAALADPYPLYAKLRHEAPVARAEIPRVGTAWILSRYKDVSGSLKDPRLLNDRKRVQNEGRPDEDRWLPRIARLFDATMIAQDDPNHQRLRRLVHLAWTPKRVAQLADRVTTTVNALLDRAAQRRSVDLIQAFAVPFPLMIISEIIGVPEKDRERFRRLSSGLIESASASMVSFLRAIPRLIGVTRFFDGLIRLRQAEPRDDLTSALLQARSEGDAQLSYDEVVAMLCLLLIAGYETTTNLIGNGTLALLEHPDQLALLRKDPDLMGSALEELLRYSNPVVQLTPRWTREEVSFHGVVIPKGEAIVGLAGSANRDETVFEDADKLDITRKPNHHIAFGLGVHYCLGAALARLEGTAAILSLVQRFPRLRLAVSPKQLRWRHSNGLRGLEALPVHLY